MTDLDVRAATEPGGDPEEELRSLMRWLHEDEGLHRQVRGTLTASRGPRPGEMGLGFDLLQLALGTAVSGGSLAVSVLQWRDARRRARNSPCAPARSRSASRATRPATRRRCAGSPPCWTRPGSPGAMTGLPDPATSRAVLLGTASYHHLDALPSVEANLRDLAATLGDATVWGLPEPHCEVVLDPGSADAMLDPVHRAGDEATDTLVVYYAGHGMRDTESADLYLGLTGSRDGVGYTAVAYQHLRGAIRSARARRKIIVLDCCFSGRAVRTLAGQGDVLAARAAVDGAYVLTASPRDRVALAPDGERHTAFTGELLGILRHGLTDGPELLDLDTLYRALTERLGAKNRPLPQRAQENGVGRLPLARNRALAQRRAPPGRCSTPRSAPPWWRPASAWRGCCGRPATAVTRCRCSGSPSGSAARRTRAACCRCSWSSPNSSPRPGRSRRPSRSWSRRSTRPVRSTDRRPCWSAGGWPTCSRSPVTTSRRARCSSTPST
ncbi:caspase family protein [Streptomyces noursei]|nr:caspase family protein [Streptomyces noursei]